MPEQEFKRHIAHKARIGDILTGQVIMEGDRFKYLELNSQQLVRANLIANIVDKYVQDGEKKFASITLDDSTGQIKLKVFGEDIKKFESFSQGDTILTIGLLRSWNNELYLSPEIMKKREPAYLVVRKLELESDKPKVFEKSELSNARAQILQTVKAHDDAGGIDVERMILDLKSSPDIINNEIRKLLEEGLVYEPRPGKLRYLG
ncbi:MAG TPA: OB-fold nucleic acid binding domain-containing protein [Candidatus Nanoarchaeia archaeon]|nr:OB-fold nucleic acid binding domain-containing protein [Candidatus Nanoarchaeia archaeon]